MDMYHNFLIVLNKAAEVFSSWFVFVLCLSLSLRSSYCLTSIHTFQNILCSVHIHAWHVWWKAENPAAERLLYCPNAKGSGCLAAEVARTLRTGCTGSTSCDETMERSSKAMNTTWQEKKMRSRYFSSRLRKINTLPKNGRVEVAILHIPTPCKQGFLTLTSSSFYSSSDWLPGCVRQHLLACCTLHC